MRKVLRFDIVEILRVRYDACNVKMQLLDSRIKENVQIQLQIRMQIISRLCTLNSIVL